MTGKVDTMNLTNLDKFSTARMNNTESMGIPTDRYKEWFVVPTSNSGTKEIYSIRKLALTYVYQHLESLHGKNTQVA